MMRDTGWHFVGERLRDGRPVPADGEWLEHDGDVVMFKSGLHYSRRIIDALKYASGSTICRVEVEGCIDYADDKGAGNRRRILWRVDGEELLREFARRCALDVVHLWDAPEVVVRYLKTGEESLRDAAWVAARAARDARDAAWDALAAARAAARDARDAAWDALAAARAAARDARDAAWDALAAALDNQNKRLTAMVNAARVQ